MAKMRKVANEADKYFIENHSDVPAEIIAQNIQLSIDEVVKYIIEPEKPKKKKAKKKEETPEPSQAPKLGRSKIQLKSGAAVYQMTEDIDTPSGTPKPKNSKEQDERAGIYRRK